MEASARAQASGAGASFALLEEPPALTAVRLSSRRSRRTLVRLVVTPMKQPTFLARKTFSQPNYLLAAMAAAFVIALAPLGAYKAVRTASNSVDEWLPSSHTRVQDLRWFRDQFGGDQFVLVSWDGCTLAQAGKLQRVARRLISGDVNEPNRDRLFTRVTTGPEMLAQLTAPPYNVPYDAAIRRLEGSLIGPAGAAARNGRGESARPTCLAAYLSPAAIADERLGQQALASIREAVAAEAHVELAAVRMAGPGVDAPTINAECRTTLLRWGLLGGVLSFAVIAWRLKSARAAAAVTAAAIASAAISLALVYYLGVFEVLALGRETARIGVADAIIFAVPLVVFVLALSAALRLLYYYRDARLDRGVEGAAERAVADGWPAWLMAGLLLAATLGVLCLSELAPARRIGLFTGLGVITGIVVLLAILSVVLHRYPLSEALIQRQAGPKGDGSPPRWLNAIFEAGMAGRAATVGCCLGLFALSAWGLSRLDVSAQLPPLVAEGSDLASDYAWFGDRVAHAVPLEVVVTAPAEHCREPNEGAEDDGQQYRLTMLERMQLMREIEKRVLQVPRVSGVLSAATFMPVGDEAAGTPPSADDEAGLRQPLEAQGLLRTERQADANRPSGRELWLASVRVAASTPHEINYADVISQLHAAVDPVLLAYRQRDIVVQALHERAQRLQGATVTVLFRAAGDADVPPENSQERLVGDLLRRSGAAEVSYLNLAAVDRSGRAAQSRRERAVTSLQRHHAAVLVSAASDPMAAELKQQGVNVVDATSLSEFEGSAASPLVEVSGPRPIRAVYTGAAPVAMAASAELAATLGDAAKIATPILALVMMLIAWNAVAVLALMIPLLLPLVAAIGALGWLKMNIDMAVLPVAVLAAGMALDGTLHFFTWFRRGAAAGLFCPQAARMAYCRCAPATVDALLAGGAALAALGLSEIAAARLLAPLGLGILIVSAASTLLLLPAMAAGPLGRFLGALAEPSLAAAGVKAAPEISAFPGRADAAAATAAPAPHRVRPAAIPADERREPTDAPHAALQAKLQRLRRGDRPSS